MTKSGKPAAALAVAVLAVVIAGGAAGRATAPPAGLTSYGRATWNLDALLHDTFGRHPVYLSTPSNYPKAPRNFSTTSGADCCSSYYLYSFANAARSAFKTVGPTKPPRPQIGAAGYEVPLTIRGAYIYCGGSRWLFEHGGNGPANWQISCHR